MPSPEIPTANPAQPDRPVTPPGGEPPPPLATRTGPPRHPPRWRRLLLFLVVLVFAGGFLFWWWQTRDEVFTDNVYVVANITPIASEVPGQVVALFVDDNMIVQPGDPIAQIDPVSFQIQVDQALADYKQATHDAEAADVTARYTTKDRLSLLEGAHAKRAEAEQAVAAAQVEVQTRTRLHQKEEEVLASLKARLPGLVALRRNAEDYYTRFKSLAGTGDIPVQESDNREAAYRDAVAKLESLLSDIKAAERQVLASELQLQEAGVRLEQSRKAQANAVAAVGRAEAEQLQPTVAANTAIALRNKQRLAEAKLRLAKLNLSNTLIRAPQAGIISRRAIQLGQTIESHKPFLSIVPLDLDNVWVVANLREEQMARVRVGQPVRIAVDAIPERTFDGWVESVAGGTGSVFSLFPPDNATGNFVRVVQRLSVRVRFADKENYQNRIRPGLSARITVDTMRYVRQSGQQW
jgi:membrane fusion protein (multidrug efflux system)